MSKVLPEIITIPQYALDELRDILQEDVGDAELDFSNEDLHDLSEFLLTLTALVKNRQARLQNDIDY